MISSLPRVLVAGVSVRSLARSAIAAGYPVVTADGYGDRDLVEPEPAPLHHLTVSPFDPHAVGDHVTMPYDAMAWTSNFENYPAVLERLSRGRVMLGNTPATLREARRAERVQEVLQASGLDTAPVYAGATDAAEHASGRALVAKPRRSGGGQGVRRWRPTEPMHEGELLQEWIEGVPASLTFVADGVEVEALGLTRQLIGDAAFGADDHRWCGNLLGDTEAGVLPAHGEVLASAIAAARALTRAFGLRGINGIDFIARDGSAVVIEVNPRWTAAVELAERRLGTSLFPCHVAGCEGTLPSLPDPVTGGVLGKAVVFAPVDLVASDTDAWLADDSIRDVPRSGSRLPRGAPICTVFASAASATACREALASRARAVVQMTLQ